jgi:hypothetical protein
VYDDGTVTNLFRRNVMSMIPEEDAIQEPTTKEGPTSSSFQEPTTGASQEPTTGEGSVQEPTTID